MWTLVELPPNRSMIGCKWIFHVKENSDGTLNKYKARLVTKGYHQHYGVDFEEKLSLVVKSTTIRTMITVALASS